MTGFGTADHDAGAVLADPRCGHAGDAPLCRGPPDGSEETTDFGLLTASAVVGRPYIAPKGIPADRLAALRTAFDATMKDPEFQADAAKQRLLVTPMTGQEVEAFIKELDQTPADVIAAAKEISGE